MDQLRQWLVIQLMNLAIKLDNSVKPEQGPVTREIPMNGPKAIVTVQSILSYIKKDSERYGGDITAAVLEFQLLNELEKEYAFFYLIGQFFEVTGLV